MEKILSNGKRENLLTSTEVAARLRITVPTVRRMFRSGKFVGAFPVGVGKRDCIRIPESAVERIEQNRPDLKPVEPIRI